MELHEIADGDIGEDQIKIFHESLNRVLSFGRQSILAQHTLNEIYELFCKVINVTQLLEPIITQANFLVK